MEHKSVAAVVTLLALLVTQPQRSAAQAGEPAPAIARPATTDPMDALVQRLTQHAVSITDAAGQVIGTRYKDSEPPEGLPEQTIVDHLGSAKLTPKQAAKLWEFFASEYHGPVVTLPIITALIRAGDTPLTRGPMWSELSGQLRAEKDRNVERQRSLVGFFERHRATLQPLLIPLRETEASGNEMVDLMVATGVFAPTFDESLAWMIERNPAALARRMERDRGRGSPVAWEKTAFKGMIRWRNAHLIADAAKPPTSLEMLDTWGEAFITIFNCLHNMDKQYRETMLRGMGPVEVFNAVVGGENELYRLGTSTYRDYLHAIVMRGLKTSKSFEAFLESATPHRLGGEAVRASGRRGMVLLRVLASFGLLEPVLSTVQDRDRFIDAAILSLGDAERFEGNSSVLMDVLLARTTTPAVTSFKRALLEKLYDRHDREVDPTMQRVFGSMLSVYQTVSEDHRDRGIDRAFPLDGTIFNVPFRRLFSPDGRGGVIHRMFMRMDEDVTAVRTYGSFQLQMRLRGAAIRAERHFDVYRITRNGRVIEIYANRPNARGVRQGIPDIAEALRNHRVETVIGRGHTSIITPLLESSKRVLGDRVKTVAMVIVGTCGGDASVRDFIDTFGYVPFVTTRSTGRLTINNAIIETYINALFSLPRGDTLDVDGVLDRATARFDHRDADLRDDASLYRVSMTAVFTAYLFDTHVRQQGEARTSVVPAAVSPDVLASDGAGSSSPRIDRASTVTGSPVRERARRVADPIPARQRRPRSNEPGVTSSMPDFFSR